VKKTKQTLYQDGSDSKTPYQMSPLLPEDYIFTQPVQHSNKKSVWDVWEQNGKFCLRG